jgi:hypothetical protein
MSLNIVTPDIVVALIPLVLALITAPLPGHIAALNCPGCNPTPPLPGFLYFWNMRFQINFPNDWNIIQNLPNTIRFNAPGTYPHWAHVEVNWGSPAPSWILDKSAWISNMTKQGIIVDRIDNTTTVANNTGLVISFVDNDIKYSVALTKLHNLVLDLVYSAPINDFQTYEDKANTMLSTLQSNGWEPTSWQDSKCSYSTLFTNFVSWFGCKSGTCQGER